MTPLNGLQKVFLVLAVAMIGLLRAPAFSMASAPFNDDFDGYTLGAINGQGNWTSAGIGCQVTDIKSNSGENSLACAVNQTAINKNFGTALMSGIWYFDLWLHPNQTTTTPLYDVVPYEGNTGKGFMKFCGKSPSDDYYTIRTTNCAGAVLLDNITADLWHRFGIEWNGTQMRINVDGGTWSSWVNKSLTTGINGIYIGNDQGLSQNYFDTLDANYIYTPPTIGGTFPIITPEKPPDAETTIVDFGAINISGNIQIPTVSKYKWKTLYIYLADTNSISRYYDEITLPDLVGSDTFDYSDTFNLDAVATTTPETVYKISYSIWGVWNSIDYPEYNGLFGLSVPYEVAGTYITETGTPSGGIPFVVVDEWEPPALENCDDPAYSILEKFTCKIQNSLLGLVIPSKESVNNLFGTFQQFQDKFPFSYIESIKNSIEDIKDGVNESATISVTILGQTGNISLAFWSQPTTIGGVSTTIGAVIKSMVTFALILLFLVWGINYLHRIV